MFRQAVAVLAVAAWFAASGAPEAQIRLADESDRAAFRAWFVLLADAQFERQTDDVQDCAALVRHAVREALRAHTLEWARRSGLPFTSQFADVRSAPRAGADDLPLFRVTSGPAPKYAESDGDDWVVYHTGPLDGGPGEGHDRVSPGTGGARVVVV